MERALNYLSEAESLSVYPTVDLCRDKGLTYTRLGRYNEAKTYFQKYLEHLNEFNSELRWVHNEKKWTKKMIYKSEKL